MLMKHCVRRFSIRMTILLLTFTLLCTHVPVCAFSIRSDRIVMRDGTTVADGLLYEELYASDGTDVQRGYLFTYTQGQSVQPVFTTGNAVYGSERVLSMAQSLADMGHTVIGGTNGDFYSMATGIPLGILIDDGVYISDDAGANALGIRADGSFVIGQPAMRITLRKYVDLQDVQIPAEGISDGMVSDSAAADEYTADGVSDHEDGMNDAAENDTDEASMLSEQTIPVTFLNKYPSVWGSYLCTPRMGDTTHAAERGTDYVFRLDSGSFSVGKTPQATLVEIRHDVTNGVIPEDGFVIAVHHQFSGAAAYAALAVGDRVAVEIGLDAAWEDVRFAIGGGDILVENGVVCENIMGEEHAKINNPRTAIGYTAEGELKLFAVDGRSTSSLGMKMDALAQTMVALGCVGAINLDGGGSTTVVLRAEDGRLSVENIPAGGEERRVSNAILFVNTAESDGIPYHAEITASHKVVYKRSPTALDIAVYDRSMKRISDVQIRPVWSCEGGVVDDRGVLTPNAADTESVTVYAAIAVTPGQEDTYPQTVLVASRTIRQTRWVDSIRTDTKAMTVAFGETSAPVPVEGEWYGFRVSVAPAYLRSVISEPALGFVDSELCIHGGERPDDAFLARHGYPSASVQIFLDDVRKTHGCRLDVIFGAAQQTVLNMEEASAETVFLTDEAGKVSTAFGFGYRDSSALLFDGLWAAPRQTPYAEHPVKALQLYVMGDVPQNLYASVFYDGVSYRVPWVTEDDFMRLKGYRRITADLRSVNENGICDFVLEAMLAAEHPFFVLTDELVYIYDEALPPFTDTMGTWAADDIDTLYRMGVINGIANEDGSFGYCPDAYLTRAAFAKLLSEFAALSLSEKTLSGSLLPFADAKEIDDWALLYVTAVCRAGLMKGKGTGTVGTDGEEITVFAGADVMTRAEVMQALGTVIVFLSDHEETFPSGFFETPFSDDADIPAWARERIVGMTALGLISGFPDGSFRPHATITRAEIASLLVRIERYFNT